MKKLLNTALLLFAVLMTSCTAPNAWELVSKDSNVRFALENKQENGSTMLSYSVFKKRWSGDGEISFRAGYG